MRGERLTGGPRVKMCCVEVELPEWEVVGGLGWPGGTASASFLFLQTEIKGQKYGVIGGGGERYENILRTLELCPI